MSRTTDSRLADPEQCIAELKRQLAERTADLEESETQKRAMAEVLGVINASAGDLGPVFDAMLEKAMRLCGAAFGTLQTFDGERWYGSAASTGVPLAFNEFRKNNPPPYGPGTISDRILKGEPLVHTVDLKAEELYRSGDPNRRALVDLAGARSSLVVPLLKDRTVLGVIQIFRKHVQPFSDKQITLLQNFAAQAVIAMENARLLTETQEALEQQTATAEVLQVINSSPGDLQPVFDTMLEKAMRLCGAAFGYFMSYDGEKFESIALRGVPREFAEWLNREPLRPGPLTGLGRIARGAPLIHIPDLVADEAYRQGDPVRIATVELGGARTWLGVPLSKDEQLLGVLMAYRQETRPFGDKQIALLQNFAAQAVIATENARLLTETREALALQTGTAEILSVINNSPGDLTPVFDAMLDRALCLCEGAFGTLFTFDGEFFYQAATRNRKVPIDRPFRSTPKSAGGRLLRGERFVHIADAREDEAYRSGDPARMRLVENEDARSYLAVPMRKGEVLLGNIAIYRLEVRPFSDKQIALLENFAAQAVIAMENARLLGELRQRTDEVAELNRGLEARVAEQVEELGRVGRLKRFLAPQLAELIVSQGDEKILESHRREIVVVFCDLRGYTAFTETAEPEEVLDFLREYHGALGPLVSQFEGTLDQFTGDGIMVFFNDPVPIPDPAQRAVKMAMAMRDAAGTLIASWRRRGRMLGFGAGIAQGYATLGQIGFADRSGYTAIGTVCNLAARLCAEAKDGQILIAQRVAVAVEETTPLEEVGELSLKGLTQPVVAYNVPLAATQPALRVIEDGPPSA